MKDQGVGPTGAKDEAVVDSLRLKALLRAPSDLAEERRWQELDAPLASFNVHI